MPVAVVRAAAHARPSWTLEVLPGVGHVPQLEVPERTAQLITGWLGQDGRDGAARAGAGAQASPVRAAFRTAGQKVSRAVRRSRSPARINAGPAGISAVRPGSEPLRRYLN